MNRDRGQATVELALVLPFVILLLLFVAQVGVVVRDRITLVHAAREAVRVAVVDRDDAEVQRAVERVLPTASLDVRTADGIVEVVVGLRVPTALPVVGPILPDLTFEERASGRVEP